MVRGFSEAPTPTKPRARRERDLYDVAKPRAWVERGLGLAVFPASRRELRAARIAALAARPPPRAVDAGRAHRGMHRAGRARRRADVAATGARRHRRRAPTPPRAWARAGRRGACRARAGYRGTWLPIALWVRGARRPLSPWEVGARWRAVGCRPPASRPHGSSGPPPSSVCGPAREDEDDGLARNVDGPIRRSHGERRGSDGAPATHRPRRRHRCG